MDARRARILVVTIFLVSLVLPLVVASAAAATCTLSAPATVAVGTPLAITGSEFPASSTADVTLTVEGGSPDAFTVQSDATGAFQINLTPEAADEGTTTVVATSGAGCTAQIVFTVGDTAVTPEPTEGAGGAGGAGAAGPPRTAAGPPRTDAAPEPGAWTSSARPTAWVVAFVLLAFGVGGLIVTRPARSH